MESSSRGPGNSNPVAGGRAAPGGQKGMSMAEKSQLKELVKNFAQV